MSAELYQATNAHKLKVGKLRPIRSPLGLKSAHPHIQLPSKAWIKHVPSVLLKLID